MLPTNFIALLESMIKDATPELIYENDYQLVVAVFLSPQTTDKKVNQVTKILFSRYKNFKELAIADISDVEGLIKPLGLYHIKSRNLIDLAKDIEDNYHGIIPDNLSALLGLRGVGRKVALIVLSSLYKHNYFPIDTHILRIFKRLKIDYKSVYDLEKIVTQTFTNDDLYKLHLRLILFGRRICSATNPKCNLCLFTFCQSKEN